MYFDMDILEGGRYYVYNIDDWNNMPDSGVVELKSDLDFNGEVMEGREVSGDFILVGNGAKVRNFVITDYIFDFKDGDYSAVIGDVFFIEAKVGVRSGFVSLGGEGSGRVSIHGVVLGFSEETAFQRMRSVIYNDSQKRLVMFDSFINVKVDYVDLTDNLFYGSENTGDSFVNVHFNIDGVYDVGSSVRSLIEGFYSQGCSFRGQLKLIHNYYGLALSGGKFVDCESYIELHLILRTNYTSSFQMMSGDSNIRSINRGKLLVYPHIDNEARLSCRIGLVGLNCTNCINSMEEVLVYSEHFGESYFIDLFSIGRAFFEDNYNNYTNNNLKAKVNGITRDWERVGKFEDDGILVGEEKFRDKAFLEELGFLYQEE